MNGNRAKRKKIKRHFRKLGISLLFQGGLLWAVVIAFMVVQIFPALFLTPDLTEQQMEKQFINPLQESGWPMILAVVIAFIPLLIYRKKLFWTHDLTTVGKRMNRRIVFIGFVFVLGLNMIFMLIMYPVEGLLHLFGYTAEPSEEILEGSKTISMFVYTCLIAPIFEEFIYRGAVLRSLERFGSFFAITGSALLFGMMHGNIIQLPVAFGTGIVLGYLAKTYSIWLTILIHSLNNLLSEAISAVHSEVLSAILNSGLLVAVFLVLGVFLYKNRNAIRSWLHAAWEKRPEKKLWLYFFTSIPIILLLLFNGVAILLGIEKL
ncbi:CPBP family intramembrane glutamic endopeptidase [Sporolactobacillus terrae]|nr:type II CAAX endopeptidase family protein [Sporolactobacillus terrae]UAK15744.1 CPBP family intramembrane metalloprotease [Sporolactobacillus terrae]